MGRQCCAGIEVGQQNCVLQGFEPADTAGYVVHQAQPVFVVRTCRHAEQRLVDIVEVDRSLPWRGIDQ